MCGTDACGNGVVVVSLAAAVVVVVVVVAVKVVAVAVQQSDPGRANAWRANRGVKIAGLANEGDLRQEADHKG